MYWPSDRIGKQLAVDTDQTLCLQLGLKLNKHKLPSGNYRTHTVHLSKTCKESGERKQTE